MPRAFHLDPSNGLARQRLPILVVAITSESADALWKEPRKVLPLARATRISAPGATPMTLVQSATAASFWANEIGAAQANINRVSNFSEVIVAATLGSPRRRMFCYWLHDSKRLYTRRVMIKTVFRSFWW